MAQEAKFKTEFDMVIHTPGDTGLRASVREAKVDTASDLKVIRQIFVDEFGFRITKPYLGPEMGRHRRQSHTHGNSQADLASDGHLGGISAPPSQSSFLSTWISPTGFS